MRQVHTAGEGDTKMSVYEATINGNTVFVLTDWVHEEVRS